MLVHGTTLKGMFIYCTKIYFEAIKFVPYINIQEVLTVLIKKKNLTSAQELTYSVATHAPCGGAIQIFDAAYLYQESDR